MQKIFGEFAGEHGFKCRFCDVCDGTGCVGQIPGMGGFCNSENFRLNCDGWKVVRKSIFHSDKIDEFFFAEKQKSIGKENFGVSNFFGQKSLALAPLSGGVENVGFCSEELFYEKIYEAAIFSKIGICVGDGFPDLKIKAALKALKKFGKKGAIFLKPYPDEKIFERIEWASENALIFGIDIDSFSIATMKNLTTLEQKNSSSLKKIKNAVSKIAPFAIKGVFTNESVKIVQEVKPDIVYISNHGGRVETRTGSTAEFMMHNAKLLKNFCAELWVDGGIRTNADLKTAQFLGANCVLLGRPIISALCTGGKNACKKINSLVKNLVEENPRKELQKAHEM